MASSTIFSFTPALSIRSHATPGSRSVSASARSTGSGRSSNWWSPIFGWSAQPDYIDPATATATETERKRFGVFTEEKAKELRKKMMETETYHDAMYHSAIASRLASDRKGLERN